MTAKQYLSGLKALNAKIAQKLQEAQELRALAFGVGSLASDNECVQSSPSGDGRQITLANRYLDLEAEIQVLVDKYVVMKDEIINRIHQLEDARYVEVLFKRYVECKPVKQIAREMNYQYDALRRVHRKALRAFENGSAWPG